MSGTWLLIATLLLPASMALACISASARARMPDLLVLAPLPALAAALFALGSPPLVLDAEDLRFTLDLTPASAMLLGATSLLWSLAGAYAASYLREDAGKGRFAVSWLLTLTGSLGVFLAADLATFYLMFALVSLAAYGLVVQDGTARARRAGVIYLVLAVLGEICLLLAFALMHSATPGDSLAIHDVVAALPSAPGRHLIVTLLILGFGLKAGLVPLHVWLPLAHPAAPMPASAVLSGAIIKAGIIGLIRFLPFGESLPGWGEALTVIGLFTAFYGVAIGITQSNPKTVLAYSSVSQMGVTAAVLGLALAAGNVGWPQLAAFYAVHHVLAKGAMFLAVGVVASCGGARLHWVLVPAGLLVLGFGGLPLTGGGVAKLAVKDVFAGGWLSTLSSLSAAGTTMLMTHFLCRLLPMAAAEQDARPPLGLVWPCLALACAAMLLPWALYLGTGMGTLSNALTVDDLWAGCWPVLLGLVLAQCLARWGRHLPTVPEGDMLVLAKRSPPVFSACGDVLERGEAVLRQWPVAGTALLGLAVLLALALWPVP
jgi:formate hydrogenlyase subunit 3/multisubunit Na+/H+ antiporter MnhD subunit